MHPRFFSASRSNSYPDHLHAAGGGFQPVIDLDALEAVK
jgi:hypothetical protein